MEKSTTPRARPFVEILRQLKYEFQSGQGAFIFLLIIVLTGMSCFFYFGFDLVGLLVPALYLGMFTLIVIGRIFVPIGPQGADILPQALGFLFSRALPRASVCRARCVIVFALLALPALLMHARSHASPELEWQTPKTSIPGFAHPADAYQKTFGEDCTVTVPVDPASPIRLRIRNGRPAMTSMYISLYVTFIGLVQWIAVRSARGRHSIFWIYLAGVAGIPSLFILARQFNLLETAFLIHSMHPWLCLTGAILIYAAFYRATERRFCNLEL